uniref:Fork-head domain-containing protein n=1 Tax=Panagrolaimus sp. PS1159 TaxID=55785 RepID=A0AC35ETM1_9BILA
PTTQTQHWYNQQKVANVATSSVIPSSQQQINTKLIPYSNNLITMSTTSAEIIPEYGTTYLPMNNKNTTTTYINVSTPQTVTHQLPNGYATTTNGYSAAPEFTNLTPLMSGPLPPTSQFTAQQILSNTSFLNDHREDSGISSHNGSLLMSTAGLPQMNGFGSPQMETKLEDDLDAMPRDRCNTWPLRRPTLDINAQTSPLIHDRIPEEETIYDSSENLSQSGMLGPGDIQSNNGFSNDFVQIGSPDDLSQDGGNDSPNSSAKKATTRRNAWGNMSYADLITQAILNSPEKRLTLSQVYEWMVQNVPYFRDKGDSNSSAGWKVINNIV